MPGLSPNDTRSGRTYTWGNEVYASVTTILNALSKPALPPWAAKMCATYVCEEWQTLQPLLEAGRFKEVEALVKGAPWRARDAAADLGTYVHHLIDSLLSGEASPIDTLAPEVRPHLAHFQNFLDVFQPEILEHEVTIFNQTTGPYAGTLDLLCRINRKCLLVDFKTGKGVYPETALQIAAYSRGEFIGRRDGSEAPMPIIDGGAVLHIRPNLCELIPVRIDESVFMSFRYILEAYRWQQDLAPLALQGVVRHPDALMLPNLSRY